MRIGGIIAVAIFVVVGFLAAFFITDDWIESQIEYQASVLNEAKVEFDGFDVSVFSLHVKWDRLQVANRNSTMQNSFETGNTEFSMEFWPLILGNKVVVDNVKLTGFEMDTDRDSDGAFEVPKEVEDEEPGFISSIVQDVSSEAQKNAETKFTDIRTNLNVDSLMAKVNIQSIGKIDSLQKGIQKTYTKWDSTFQHTDINQEVADIEQQIKALDVKGIKDPKKAVKAIEKVKNLRKKVDALKERATTMKTEFEQDYGSSRNSIGKVDDWIRADYEKALGMAKLPDLDVKNIGQALFGKNLLGDYGAYLEYIAIARKYGSRLVGDEDEEPEIPRYEGIDIRFSDKYDWPGFWFKNIELSGQTKSELKLAGEITNISSSQQKTGLPLQFKVMGQDAKNVSLSLKGSFNYLEEKPKESFNLNYDGFNLSNTRLSGSDLLPYKLDSGKGEVGVQLDIIGKRIDSKIDYLAKDIQFDFEDAGKPKNRIETLIRDAISSTNEIDVTALVDNTDGPLRVRIRSNVDDLFMNALKKTVSQEVEKARAKVRAEVDKQVAGKKEKLEAFKAGKEAEIQKRYEAIQQKVDEQLQRVEEKKKELEGKKKELENAAKDKIKDKIGIDF